MLFIFRIYILVLLHLLKKITMSKHIISLFLSISFFTVFAQKWDLETCISYALEHNIQIKQQDLNTKISENTGKQAKLGLLPNLNMNANRGYSFGRAVDPYTNRFTENDAVNDNFGISSSFTIFSGLQKINTIKQTKLDLMASQQDLEKIKNDISLNVASAYLTILFDKELLKIAKDQADITKKQVERTKNIVEVGNAARGDLLQLEAQYSNEQLNVVNAQNRLDIDRLNLIQLLELDSVTNFEIEEPNTDNFTYKQLPELDEVIAQAQKLPEIKAAEYRLMSAQKALQIKQGARYPTLTLSLGYNTGYSDQRKIIDQSTPYTYIGGYTESLENVYLYSMQNTYKSKPMADQLNDNRSASIGINLSIPIFNNWQVNTSISNAKISVMNQEYALKLQKNNLQKAIQQKYTEAIAARTKYFATKKTVDAYTESFKYTEEKFNVGLLNSVDYNLEKNKLIKAKSDLLQAKYEFIFKIKILDFYLGKKLSLKE